MNLDKQTLKETLDLWTNGVDPEARRRSYELEEPDTTKNQLGKLKIFLNDKEVANSSFSYNVENNIVIFEDTQTIGSIYSGTKDKTKFRGYLESL